MKKIKKKISKKELLNRIIDIRDLINGTADPYANNEQVIIQIQSIVSDILDEEPWYP